MLMGHGTKRSLIFSTTTTNKNPSTATKKVVTKLGKTTLKASPSKEISLHKAKPNLLPLLNKREELCSVNANGTWYKKEPNFQYNNYQQKPFYNNQQGGYQARENYSQGFSSKENQSTQGQAGSSTSAPQESSTDAMLKHILESQTRSEKHIGYQLKNLHTKVDGSYNDLNNKFLQLSSHFKTLENQFAYMPSTSKSPMGSLPGNSEQNPKEYCNVIISTTSEIELSDHEKEKDQIERLIYGTEVVAKAEVQIVEKVEHKIVERFEIQTIKKVERKVLQPVRHKAEKPVIGKAVTQLKEVQLEEAHVVEQSPYDKLPFPQSRARCGSGVSTSRCKLVDSRHLSAG
ncbi:hypothetical protein F2Q70_00001822 [Brassica cretica]|uniref:Uncharacterized protein n=1 Tax=Brassica cretica TaxID=69181 RepID=A0A8S9IKS7_BRACR|nr:hypothetical protein F2Q70_00001822 [Brassica cretica]